MDHKVKHDELDAVTSALVGAFFLAGKYEPLRAPLEDALIIPDLRTPGSSCVVVGISGRICAGKTTASQILERQGFAYTRFSLVIDDEIVARGGTPNRRTRQAVGLEIHHSKGQRWLCQKVLDRVDDQQLIVVDGMRYPEDHCFFKEMFGSKFVHLHLRAPSEARAARYPQQGEDGVPFEVADHEPVEAHVDGLVRLADHVIDNGGTIEQFAASVQGFLRMLRRRGQSLCQSRSS